MADEVEDTPVTDLAEGTLIECDAPLIEASHALVTPSTGKVLAEDGTCNIVIIRPCVSRGRRLGGLPPLYEASMLARCAGVFTGWRMYMDHKLTESDESAQFMEHLVAKLEEANRSVKDLGGRIIESWFDPNYTHPEDSQYGHMKGAVIGKVKPTPFIAGLIENDPELLSTSINAFPTKVRAHTHGGRRVALIEGIAKTPRGSVDWVVEPGAGGRVIAESEERIFSVVESLYSDGHLEGENPVTEIDLTKVSDADLAKHIREARPALAESLGGTATVETQGIDEDALAERITEKVMDRVDARLDESLETHADSLREELQEDSDRARQLHELRDTAHSLIEQAEGIPDSGKEDLKARFAITESGPTDLLDVNESSGEDGATISATDALTENVEGEIKKMRKIVSEATGGKPIVTGVGGGSAVEEGVTSPDPQQQAIDNAIKDGLAESEEAARKLLGLPEKAESEESE